MPSLKTIAAAALVLFNVVVSAQDQYYISPSSVNITTRNIWCNNEVAICPILCSQLPGASSTTKSNTCDPVTLTYTCVCGDGNTPNATEFSQTLPFYICQEWGVQCTNACPPTDTACQSACTQNHPCGAQNPVRVNITTSATTAAATGTGSAAPPSGTQTGSGASGTPPVVFNGLGGAATTSAGAAATGSAGNKGNNAPGLNVAQSYGLAVIFTGFFAGFALML